MLYARMHEFKYLLREDSQLNQTMYRILHTPIFMHISRIILKIMSTENS